MIEKEDSQWYLTGKGGAFNVKKSNGRARI